MDLSAYPTETLSALLVSIKEEMRRRRAKAAALKRTRFVKNLSPVKFPNRDTANVAIEKQNSDHLLSLRGWENCEPHARQKYLNALIMQDWSHLYPESESSDDRFYVYVHTDPREKVFVTNDRCGGNYKGTPFYVGKGTGSRAFDLKRNQGHGKRIRQVLDAGYTQDDIVHIAFSGLTESKAFELESKLVYFFKTIYEAENGTLYNLDVPVRPEFCGVMTKLATARLFRQDGDEQGTIESLSLEEA